MLAGMIVSSLLGGLAGLAFSITRELGLLHVFVSYQVGGLLAVTAFIAMIQHSSPQQDKSAN